MIIVKNLGEDEYQHGSITIPIDTYFNHSISCGTYVQWMTLFDHPDDDEYDGILNEDDTETPRIQCEFSIVEEDDGKK